MVKGEALQKRGRGFESWHWIRHGIKGMEYSYLLPILKKSNKGSQMGHSTKI